MSGKKFISLLLLLLNFSLLFAQQSKIHSYHFGVEPVFKYGKIWKHTINFKPAIEHHSFSTELNFTWQSNGNKAWQQLLHYPAWGVTAGYCFFGNKNILGSEYYVIPNVQFRLAGKKNIQLWLKGGVGLAWLTKHYDALENPSNNVIASAINNSSTVGLRLKATVTPHLQLVLGSSFTHSSTGDVRLPNLGINIPTVDFGIQYFFSPVKISDFNHEVLQTLKRKSITVTVRGGVGLYEIFIPDGPIYPIIINETGIGKYLGKWNKFSIGFESYYSTANYHLLQEQRIETKNKWESVTLSPFIQDEMEWGPVSFTMLIAYQTKSIILSGYAMYEKLGVNHTLFSFGENNQHKISIGVFLTTHLSNADYVSSLLSLQI